MNTTETPPTARHHSWIKSSYSGAEGGQCVEVAAAGEAVCIRDSKTPDGQPLAVSSKAWPFLTAAFVGVDRP